MANNVAVVVFAPFFVNFFYLRHVIEDHLVRCWCPPKAGRQLKTGVAQLHMLEHHLWCHDNQAYQSQDYENDTELAPEEPAADQEKKSYGSDNYRCLQLPGIGMFIAFHFIDCAGGEYAASSNQRKNLPELDATTFGVAFLHHDLFRLWASSVTVATRSGAGVFASVSAAFYGSGGLSVFFMHQNCR